jgi:transcription initiation factor TFIID subunit 5
MFSSSAIKHIHSLLSSPVGDFFASASMDHTAKIWSTDRIFPLRSLIGHLSDVNVSAILRTLLPAKTFVFQVVKYHPNGNYLATGSSDRTIRMWDAQQGQTVRLFQRGHKAGIYALAFSPCGKYLASAGNCRLFILVVRFHFLDAGEDFDILVWDLSSGKVCKELKGHTAIVHSLAFNDDSCMLASGRHSTRFTRSPSDNYLMHTYLRKLSS